MTKTATLTNLVIEETRINRAGRWIISTRRNGGSLVLTLAPELDAIGESLHIGATINVLAMADVDEASRSFLGPIVATEVW